LKFEACRDHCVEAQRSIEFLDERLFFALDSHVGKSFTIDEHQLLGAVPVMF
jgi:hypothetical protein